MTELLTNNQRKTKLKHERIVCLYDSMSQMEVPRWRKVDAIAKKMNMTPQGIRKILIKHNRYDTDRT